MTDEYDIDVRQEADYLRITASGERSFQRTERLLHVILAEARARDARRVLLDSTGVTGELSLTYRYTLGEQVAQLFAGTGIKLAVSSYSDGASPFTATVARGRGADYAVFYSEPEAVAWLLAPVDRNRG
jgi:hypothetical protein